jgi:release factor glutamine methyltransferase
MALTPADDRCDGLADIKRIVGGAAARLHPGAWLLIEHGADQGDGTRTLFEHAGFCDVQARPDLAGRPRATGGRSTQ